MSKLIHIADRVLNRPLMVLPEKLALIAQVLDGRINIDASELKEIEVDAHLREGPDASRFVGDAERLDPNNPRSQIKYRISNGVATIPVLGSLVNRGAWIGANSGMTSYEGLAFQIEDAGANPKVNSIVLDMDSPGGEAVGAFEIAEKVRAVAKSKPVIAVVNGMAASAAYAIASAASQIVSTPSGVSGSIGVVMLHADYSVALHERGIKPTLIHAGAHKVDGNPYEPLSDAVKADLKAEVDQFYNMFVSSVAAGRKGRMTEKSIRGTEARTFIGNAALEAGLVDAIGSFETVLADLSAKAPKQRSAPKKSPASTGGLQLETQNLAVVLAVPPRAAPEGATVLGAGPAPGPDVPAVGQASPQVPTFEDIVAAANLTPAARPDAEQLANSWDAAFDALKGKSVLPLGPGWEEAIAKASGKLPNSPEPGYGWMAVIAELNGKERSREPLLYGWDDVVAAVNREAKGGTGPLELDSSWEAIVARLNSRAIR